MESPSLQQAQKYRNLAQRKRHLIDFTFYRTRPRPHSVADLGGMWAVDGAYTFYTLDTYDVEKAVLVDTNLLDSVIERAQQYPHLTTLRGNFGEPSVIEQVGAVDVVFLFDILLHQVSPDWDEILDIYAPNARYVAILNQQFTGSKSTVRLLDLGPEEYFKNVPRDPMDGPYRDLFGKLDEIHPEHNRPWRDVHNIWQWGITDDDLIEKMRGLGFKMQYFINWGRFQSLEHFEHHAFVFQKT